MSASVCFAQLLRNPIPPQLRHASDVVRHQPRDVATCAQSVLHNLNLRVCCHAVYVSVPIVQHRSFLLANLFLCVLVRPCLPVCKHQRLMPCARSVLRFVRHPSACIAHQLPPAAQSRLPPEPAEQNAYSCGKQVASYSACGAGDSQSHPEASSHLILLFLPSR